jgi:hypothetical protein
MGMLAILPWGTILTVEFLVILAPFWLPLFEELVDGLGLQKKKNGGARRETEEGRTPVVEQEEQQDEVQAEMRVLIPPWDPERYARGLQGWREQKKEAPPVSQAQVVMPESRTEFPREPPLVSREPPMEAPPVVRKRRRKTKRPGGKELKAVEKKVLKRMKRVLNTVRKGATNERELRAAFRAMIREQQKARDLPRALARVWVLWDDEEVG